MKVAEMDLTEDKELDGLGGAYLLEGEELRELPLPTGLLCDRVASSTHSADTLSAELDCCCTSKVEIVRAGDSSWLGVGEAGPPSEDLEEAFEMERVLSCRRLAARQQSRGTQLDSHPFCDSLGEVSKEGPTCHE